MKTKEQYFNHINRIGRISFSLLFLWIILVPVIICARYGIFPGLSVYLNSNLGLFLILTPIALSEIVSFVPLLGSGASYLAFQTGNVSNIKLPAAMNALMLSGVEPGSEEGEVLSTISVAISSIVTTVILIFAVILLAPLAPFFSNNFVKIATDNVIPALFGALTVSFLVGGEGGPVTIRGQWKAIILPFLLVALINYVIYPIKGVEGVAILIMIPVTLFWARFLYLKGHINVIMADKD